jgi:hypothetical protein
VYHQNLKTLKDYENKKGARFGQEKERNNELK